MLLPSLSLIGGFLGCVPSWPGDTASVDGTPLVDPQAFFIFPGSTSDGGWTQSHNDARLAVEEELGIVTEGAELIGSLDAEAEIAAALDDGFNVIVTASSDYIIPTLTAASNTPDANFISCCGSSSTDNLTSYFGRIYQPLYVAGTVAAEMSCTGRIGVVAAKPVPQFIRHINAFMLGARSVNPDIVMEVLWLNSFFDPKLEASHANTLVDNGADVVLVQTNSTIAIEETGTRSVQCSGEDSPVYSVGYHDDGMCDAAPERCLTSAFWNWEPYYRSRLEDMQDGSWVPEDVAWQPWIESDDSVVQLLEWPLFIPGGIRADADVLAKSVQEGSSALPFVGPIEDNTGTVKIAAGDALDDVALDRICWFVDGIVEVNSSGESVPAEVPSTCVGDY